jgi:tetratricopeptide (TPR) repeat protein
MTHSYQRSLENLNQFIKIKQYPACVKEAGTLLEVLLRDLYAELLQKVSGRKKEEVLQLEKEIGKGESVHSFTLGQLVGLFSRGKLLSDVSQPLGRKFRHLTPDNLHMITKLRNKLSSGEKSADFYYTQGIFARNRRDNDNALKLLMRAVEIDPKHSEAWMELGGVYFDKRLYDEEINACRKAVEADPKNYDARYYWELPTRTKGYMMMPYGSIKRLCGSTLMMQRQGRAWRCFS